MSSLSKCKLETPVVGEFLEMMQRIKKSEDRVGHYLQPEPLLKEIADSIKVSIDTDN